MKKVISLILAIILCLSALAGAAMADGEKPMLISTRPMSDVQAGAWYAAYVEKCVNMGWIACREDGTFAPDEVMTRGDFVTALYGVYGLRSWKEAVSYGGWTPFDDVPDFDEDYELYHAAAWAYETGVVKGKSNDKFDPEGSLTREEAATMLYRFLGAEVSASAGGKTFTDDKSVSSWAKEAVRWANSAGLLGGYADGSVKPQNKLTRAECAKLVCRAASLENAEDTTLLDFCAEIARLNLNGDDSAVISPVSLLYALGMLTNGADGETLAQLEKTIGLPADSLNAFMKDYAAKLAENEGNVNLANSMWINEKYNLSYEQEFLAALEEYYKAEGFSGVFDDALCDKLNKWVSDNTYGMIDKLLDEINPDASTYLVNALALDLEWKVKYTDTYDEKFTREDGTEEDCKMLHGTESVFLHDADTVGFIKDYKDGFKFVALLPDEGISMEDYLKSLTGEKIAGLLGSKIEYCDVYTRMPEFEGRSTLKLKEPLEEMGAVDMFSPANADFGRMSDGNLYVSSVVQKTYIKVYKDGTKAAAATYIDTMPTAVLSEEHAVYLDRPFVYMILDPYESLPLFIGVVNSVEG